MVHDRASWRIKTRRAALVLAAAALPFVYLRCSGGSCAKLRARRPTSMSQRIPNITPNVTSRINPNIGSGVTAIGRTTPHLRTQPSCSYAHRDSDGECSNKPVNHRPMTAAADRRRKTGKQGARTTAPGGKPPQAALKPLTVPNELVAEIDSSLSDRAGRRTGAASRPRAAAIAEFSADRRHHRPVPHRRSPQCRDGAPRTRSRRQRSLGAVELPSFSAATEAGIEPRAIPRNMRLRNFGCRRRMRWPAAPTSPLP